MRALTIILLGGFVGLAGCSSILPSRDGKPPSLYQLSAANPQGKETRPLSAQLVIEEPVANRGYDTDRIAITPSSLELKYVADARWTDRAPRMVQALLVESFENTVSSGGVGRAGQGLRADYTLATELRELLIDDSDGGAPTVSIRLATGLLKSPGGKLIAAKSFEQRTKAKGRSTRDAITAFDDAFKAVAGNTVGWTIDMIAADQKAGNERRIKTDAGAETVAPSSEQTAERPPASGPETPTASTSVQ